MKSKELPELRAAFAPMPDSFHRRIVTALGEEQKPVKVRSKITVVLAAMLIAMLVLGVTALAIARSAIMEYFYEGEPTAGAQALLHEESTCVQEQGVRMELTESLYDPQARTVYLTVRVQALEEKGALVALADPTFGPGLKATSDRDYVASPMGGGMTMLGGAVEGEKLAAETEYVFAYTFSQEPPEQVQLTLTAGVYDSVNPPVWAGPEGDDALYRDYYENRLTALCGSVDGNFVDFASYADWEHTGLRTGGKKLDDAFEAALENGFVTKRGEVALTAALTLSGATGGQKQDVMTAVQGESDLTMEVVDYAYYAPKRELTLYLCTQSSAQEPRAWGIESFCADDQTLLLDDPVYAPFDENWDRSPTYGYAQLLGDGKLGQYPLERTHLYSVRMYLPEETQPGETLTLRMHALIAVPATQGGNCMTVNPYASVYEGRALSEREQDEITRVMQLYAENGAATEVREETFEWTLTVPQAGDAHFADYQSAEFDEYTVLVRQNGGGVLRGELRFEVYLKRSMLEEEYSNEGLEPFVNTDTTDPLQRWYAICDASGTPLEHQGANFSSYRNGLGEDYFAYRYSLGVEILARDSIFIAPCTGDDMRRTQDILWEERVEVALR